MNQVQAAAAAALELRRRGRSRLISAPQPTAETALPRFPDLLEFIPRVSPRYSAPLHLRPAVEVLERMVTDGGQRLIISVPPRHGKTELLLHFIAWVLSQHPCWTIGYASYAQKFSESKTLKAQRYTLAAGVKPDPKMQNRDEWRTLEGGGILTTSIAGPLTGQGVDVLVIDDPVKDRVDAESPAMQAKSWSWFEDVAETRLEPGGSMVLLLTRWNERDLAGRILAERGGWTMIRIPALADGLDALGKLTAPDPLGREVGEALWPERYDAAHFQEIQAAKAYTFASLYQGLPRPRTAKVFGPPTFYRELPSSLRQGRGIDLAYTKSTRAHFSATYQVGEAAGCYYVLFGDRWQDVIGVSIQRLKAVQARFGGKGRLEANGPQKAVADTLETAGIHVDRFQPVSDKYTRALPLIEAWNAGRVLVPDPEVYPQHREWLNSLLEVLEAFTGITDAVDDDVDALGNGVTQILEMPVPPPLRKPFDPRALLDPSGARDNPFRV